MTCWVLVLSLAWGLLAAPLGADAQPLTQGVLLRADEVIHP